jgi:hypothetical protein
MNVNDQEVILNKICPLYTNNGSKREVRHEFFNNIVTEIQAYLLGFFAADGSIDEKRKTFRVKLCEEDRDIIELISKYISPNSRRFHIDSYEIKGRGDKTYIGRPQEGVDINSTILVNSLNDIGFGYNKTYKELKIPNISQDLIPHFIRGYFDGDGSIIGWIASEKGKSDRFRFKFEICSKYSSILEDIIDFFRLNNIKINLNYLSRDDMYRISTSSKKEVSKIFHLLYDNSNFYMSRKFNKFNYYVNTEVSQLLIDHRNA